MESQKASHTLKHAFFTLASPFPPPLASLLTSSIDANTKQPHPHPLADTTLPMLAQIQHTQPLLFNKPSPSVRRPWLLRKKTPRWRNTNDQPTAYAQRRPVQNQTQRAWQDDQRHQSTTHSGLYFMPAVLGICPLSFMGAGGV